MEPKWSYCQFFLLKEGLSFLYERCGLYQEAFRQYMELEAIFKEHAKKLIGFGGMEPGDDNSAIVELDRKRYRSLIFQKIITEFDFLQVICARQIQVIID